MTSFFFFSFFDKLAAMHAPFPSAINVQARKAPPTVPHAQRIYTANDMSSKIMKTKPGWEGFDTFLLFLYVEQEII